MNQYMLSVWHVEGEEPPSEEEMQKIFRDVDAFNAKYQDIMVFGGGLHTPDTATVVRAQGGEVVTTDGPFAEAKEHIGGFWVLKAPDLDAALKLATEASAACHGPVEVRPFQEEAAE
ncbi:MAG: YciI family protein [Actinomycetota bacterium]|nr:YciI family protein [Actinomycetota bacterium]MDQ3574100.1 YciI family protein [Actinomycetota bacterium]